MACGLFSFFSFIEIPNQSAVWRRFESIQMYEVKHHCTLLVSSQGSGKTKRFSKSLITRLCEGYVKRLSSRVESRLMKDIIFQIHHHKTFFGSCFFWFTTQTLLNQTLFDLRKKHGCTGMVGGSPHGSFLSQTKSVFLNLQKHSTIWRLFVYTENIFSELWLCSVGRLLTMSTFYQIK